MTSSNLNETWANWFWKPKFEAEVTSAEVLICKSSEIVASVMAAWFSEEMARATIDEKRSLKQVTDALPRAIGNFSTLTLAGTALAIMSTLTLIVFLGRNLVELCGTRDRASRTSTRRASRTSIPKTTREVLLQDVLDRLATVFLERNRVKSVMDVSEPLDAFFAFYKRCFQQQKPLKSLLQYNKLVLEFRKNHGPSDSDEAKLYDLTADLFLELDKRFPDGMIAEMLDESRQKRREAITHS